MVICDTWTDDVEAVDTFAAESPVQQAAVAWSFGVASPEEVNADLLRSRAVEQEVLDILDDPTPR